MKAGHLEGLLDPVAAAAVVEGGLQAGARADLAVLVLPQVPLGG